MWELSRPDSQYCLVKTKNKTRNGSIKTFVHNQYKEKWARVCVCACVGARVWASMQGRVRACVSEWLWVVCMLASTCKPSREKQKFSLTSHQAPFLPFIEPTDFIWQVLSNRQFFAVWSSEANFFFAICFVLPGFPLLRFMENKTKNGTFSKEKFSLLASKGYTII